MAVWLLLLASKTNENQQTIQQMSRMTTNRMMWLLLLVPLIVHAYHEKPPLLQNHNSKTNTPKTCRLLRIRGGTRFTIPVVSIPPQHMIQMYSGWYAFQGACFPAPEAADRSLIPETDDYLVMEHVGALSVGYAALIYMTAFATTMSMPKLVAMASLPVALVTYKNMLNGITTIMTGSRYHGVMSTLTLVAPIVAIGLILPDHSPYAVFLATFLGAQAFILGMVGRFLDPIMGRKLAGFHAGPVLSPKGHDMFARYTARQIAWGVLVFMTVPMELVATKVILVSALLETWFTVKELWLGKTSCKGGMTHYPIMNWVSFGIPFLTVVAILLHKG